MAKKRRHTAREHHVFNVLKRAVRKRHPNWSDGRIWAMTEGMAPKTLHKAAFKTTPRQYSITGRRAAAARRGRGSRTFSKATSRISR
jgi:hypothetical protein